MGLALLLEQRRLLCTVSLVVLFIQLTEAQSFSAPGTWVNDCDFCLASQGISPLEAGSSGIRVDLRYLRVGDVYRDGSRVDNSDNELETHLTQQYSVFYSVSSRLTLSGVVPIAKRHSEISSDNGTTITGDQFGLADVSLLLRYKPFVLHGMESTTIVSAAAGVKLPTGKTGGRDSEGHLLDAHIQLGTGSTDVLAGMSGFYSEGRMAFIGNLLGAITSRGANGHQFGNSLNYDASIRYNLNPDEYESAQFFATLSITGEWRGRETQDGITDENSGGNVSYIAPGVQILLTPEITFEGFFQYPVIHGLHGEQLGEDFRLATGIQFLLK